MRSCLFGALKAHPQTQDLNLQMAVAEEAARRGLLPAGSRALPHSEWSTYRDILWELMVSGVVALGADSSNRDWPWLGVTGYGQQVLASEGPVPHDPDGFLASVASKHPLDAIEKRFLGQAVNAFRLDLPDASLVMLGVCSEHLLFKLADAVVAKDPSRKSKVDREARSALRLRDYLFRLLESDPALVPPGLGEQLSTTGDTVGELLRIARNESGHPVLARHVDRGDCFMFLVIYRRHRDWMLDEIAFLNP